MYIYVLVCVYICVYIHIYIEEYVYLCACAGLCTYCTFVHNQITSSVSFKTKFLPSHGGRAGKVPTKGPTRSECLSQHPTVQFSLSLLRHKVVYLDLRADPRELKETLAHTLPLQLVVAVVVPRLCHFWKCICGPHP